MHKARLSYLLIFLVAGCAFNQRPDLEGKKMDPFDVEVPKWVAQPMEGCDEVIELCASAEGETLGIADAKARESLAQIFKIRIQSSLSTSQQSNQTTTSSGAFDGKNREQTQQSLATQTDLVLENVFVRNRYESPSQPARHFSLAVLDRRQSSKSTENQLNNLEDEMLAIEKGFDQDPASRLQWKQKYELRSELKLTWEMIRGRA